jgi:hypothetical protein
MSMSKVHQNKLEQALHWLVAATNRLCPTVGKLRPELYRRDCPAALGSNQVPDAAATAND